MRAYVSRLMRRNRACSSPLVRPSTAWKNRGGVGDLYDQAREHLDGPGGGASSGTEADLHPADIESYCGWLREGGRGSGPEEAERDMAFWM